jgi:hypothetical protein
MSENQNGTKIVNIIAREWIKRHGSTALDNLPDVDEAAEIVGEDLAEELREGWLLGIRQDVVTELEDALMDEDPEWNDY